MKRLQHIVVALSLLSTASTALSTEAVISKDKRPSAELNSRVDFDFGLTLPGAHFDDYVDTVTMTHLPAGSLTFAFDGVQEVLSKHLRSQFRSLSRRAVRQGWYTFEEDSTAARQDFYRKVDRYVVEPLSNGSRWDRSWWENLPPEKGGAPTVPYTHTFGKEIGLRLGPCTITNTLKFRFDYFAFFELNSDPESPDHGPVRNRITFDVQPVKSATIGTSVEVKLKPRVSVGLPKNEDWLSALRRAALQLSFKITHGSLKIIEGDIELKWSPGDGVVINFELALVSW